MKVVLQLNIQIRIFVSGRLGHIWPQKLTLKSENALFLMARNQTLLQYTNKCFQDVHL